MPVIRSNPKVLFVMAAPAEYGPQLKEVIDPLMIGIGPVEASVNLTAELMRRQEKPDLLVSLGSAGSRALPQTEVFQVSAVSYRDMDASALGFERGCTPFLDQPAIVPLPDQIPGIPGASLSTGGNIVSGAAYDTIDADMVDMETYAVWRVAEKFSIPMIGLRGISDGKSELRGMMDWEEYLGVIDGKLTCILSHIEKELGGWQKLSARA